MKKYLLLIFILTSVVQQYASDILDYKRIHWRELDINNFDLIEVNNFERNKQFTKADKIYSKLIEINSNNDFYIFLYNERKYLRNSSFNWGFNNINDLYLKTNEIIKGNGDLLVILPPTLILGLLETDAYGLISKNIFSKNFKLIENKTNISNLKLIENGAIFTVNNILSLNKEVDLIISCFNIKNSIYPELNNKIQIFKIEECRSKESLEYYYNNIDKCFFDIINFITYGIYEKDNKYSKNVKFKSKVNNLRIRQIPDIKGKILIEVNKDDILFFQNEINKFDYINEMFNSWIKIKTSEGIIGYCFGGYIAEVK